MLTFCTSRHLISILSCTGLVYHGTDHAHAPYWRTVVINPIRIFRDRWILMASFQIPGHGAQETAASLGTSPKPFASSSRLLYKIPSILNFTLTLTSVFSPLDLYFEFPVSTSLFRSITLPRTRRRSICPQNFIYMSMLYNNVTSSGQGLKPVRWFL